MLDLTTVCGSAIVILLMLFIIQGKPKDVIRVIKWIERKWESK